LFVREHIASVEIQLSRGLAIACVEFGPQVNRTPRFGELVAHSALDNKKLPVPLVVYKVTASFHQMKLFNTGTHGHGF
jgi:hypothetical protein